MEEIKNAANTSETGMTIVNDDMMSLVGQMVSRQLQYTSIKATTDAEKEALFNLMNNPAERLKDHVNKPIKMRHVYIEMVKMTKEETGEVTDCPRIVIVDDKGTGYACVSTGVFGALKKVFQLYGTPENWKAPVTITPATISKGKNSILTLNLGAPKN